MNSSCVNFLPSTNPKYSCFIAKATSLALFFSASTSIPNRSFSPPLSPNKSSKFSPSPKVFSRLAISFSTVAIALAPSSAISEVSSPAIVNFLIRPAATPISYPKAATIAIILSILFFATVLPNIIIDLLNNSIAGTTPLTMIVVKLPSIINTGPNAAPINAILTIKFFFSSDNPLKVFAHSLTFSIIFNAIGNKVSPISPPKSLTSAANLLVCPAKSPAVLAESP